VDRGNGSAGRGNGMRRRARAACGLAAALILGGCATGDFGRLKPSLVSDDMHAWVGKQAAREAGYRPSKADLTDDERQLRDLAYPLIEPPYDRERWDTLLLEYGIARNRELYSKRLLDRSYRSASSRYSQLIDDIRSDGTRLSQFAWTAHRVLDMDGKRHKSLAHIPDLSEAERKNAQRRIAENALIVAWVHRSLHERASAYRYVLERAVVETPSPMAVEAERALTLLRQQIAEAKLG
jgi:hypothetical protein